MPSTTTSPDAAVGTSTATIPTWRTVVWDDPINLMDYVTNVFIRHFGYSAEKARTLMLEVHTAGRAVVSSGMRERMEADVVAMHGYGLRATLEPSR
ncbi:ATP-dependent Clp protease adapter ClpS [Actinomyces culturomici]|uniref:ATP-dependent Clp protease adapter ClpS n=1 Tax=Actinomyces culturomici TaxID=1926276 RepID=UPI000E202AE0|nr:ATP-dependent Clp protease adapter ClpS [Actinomyces culturomici]